jgi:hypothetical protein
VNVNVDDKEDEVDDAVDHVQRETKVQDNVAD